MLADILNNHRGPYLFMVTRPFVSTKKEGFYRSEWLKGTVDHEDVGPEAIALIRDKRDTIEAVYVWSEREQAFVTWVTCERDL
jgi:hypothetical protein